jgi:hypothetical protein
VFEDTQELAVMNRIEVALEIALNDLVVFGPLVEQGHDSGDGIPGLATFAKPVGVWMKVGFVDWVQNGT